MTEEEKNRQDPEVACYCERPELKRKETGISYLRQTEYEKLDLYLPEEGEGPFPVLIDVHGGGWFYGSRSSRRMDPVLEGLKRGYAVASVDYTLSGAAKFPTQVYELKAAVRFLREHAKRYLLDPDRIGMWGLSAGANLAMLAAFSAAAGELEDENFGGSSGVSGRIQALVALYGPTDLTISEGCHEASMESLFLGCVPRENRELAKRANPCTYVTKDAPPCFLQCGDADELVVLEHGAVIRDALQRVRTDGDWFEVVHGAGHADALFRTRENTEKIFRFLDGHLKP